MTPAEINALPERVRLYIHDLETNADPAGTIQENGLLRDQTRELDAMIARLKRNNERYVLALQKISVMPYRGRRSMHCATAFQALNP